MKALSRKSKSHIHNFFPSSFFLAPVTLHAKTLSSQDLSITVIFCLSLVVIFSVLSRIYLKINKGVF